MSYSMHKIAHQTIICLSPSAKDEQMKCKSGSDSVTNIVLDSFSVIFDRIKQATGKTTQLDLGNALGISQSSVCDAKKRKSIPSVWYLKLFERYGVNPLWLKTGQEPVFLLDSIPITHSETMAIGRERLLRLVITHFAPDELIDEIQQTLSFRYLSLDPSHTLPEIIFKIMPGELAARYTEHLFSRGVNVPAEQLLLTDSAGKPEETDAAYVVLKGDDIIVRRKGVNRPSLDGEKKPS